MIDNFNTDWNKKYVDAERRIKELIISNCTIANECKILVEENDMLEVSGDHNLKTITRLQKENICMERQLKSVIPDWVNPYWGKSAEEDEV